jgi:hypothetical protein
VNAASWSRRRSRPRLGLGQQAAVDGGAEQGDQLVLGRLGHVGEHVERHPAAEHRGGGDEAADLRVELVELPAHQLGHRPRQWHVGQVLPGRVAGARDQLLEEERVPTRAAVERIDDRERRDLAVDGREEGVDVRGAQLPELDVGDRMTALQPGEELRGRMPAREAVRAVGADDQQPAAAGFGQLLEHREALGVGPVQILEHDDAGDPLGEPPHQLDSRPDALIGGAVGVVHGLQQRSVSVGGAVASRHRAERVTKELHGAALGARVGLSRQHHRARRGLRHQLLDKSGLADPGLAGDQRDRRVHPGVDQTDQAIELGAAPDHDR